MHRKDNISSFASFPFRFHVGSCCRILGKGQGIEAANSRWEDSSTCTAHCLVHFKEYSASCMNLHKFKTWDFNPKKITLNQSIRSILVLNPAHRALQSKCLPNRSRCPGHKVLLSLADVKDCFLQGWWLAPNDMERQIIIAIIYSSL